MAKEEKFGIPERFLEREVPHFKVNSLDSFRSDSLKTDRFAKHIPRLSTKDGI